MQLNQLIDHYRLLHPLGSGGMGDVYLAEDERLPRQVALKVIRIDPLMAADPDKLQEALRLSQREAKAIARLNHPHILPLHEYGEAQIQGTKVPYMVMPFCPDGSLETWLRQRNTATPLSLSETLFLLKQAADALQATHDHQIIHRDVKPSNFLIRSQSAFALPDLLLADFGTAAIMDATTSIGQGMRGTPTYMAPEQWADNETYATDQYALAIMAYQLLTGQLPFQGNQLQLMYQHLNVQPEPPSSLVPSLPPEVDAVILKALAKSPKQRYARIQDFVSALEQASTLLLPKPPEPPISVTLQVVSSVPPPVQRKKPVRKRTLSSVLMGVLAFLLVAVCAFFAIQSPLLARTSTTVQATKTAQAGAYLTSTAQTFASNATAAVQATSESRMKTAQATSETATAQVQAKDATATAQTQATNTVATAQAQATSTAVSQPIYQDTLKDPSNPDTQAEAWDNNSYCSFQSDGYHVLQDSTSNQHACQESGSSYRDETISVDVKILRGHSGGLFFRFGEDGFGGYSGYLFEIANTGEYQISSWSSGNLGQDWTPSPALKHDSVNTLVVMMCGNTFSFYANKTFLVKLTDDSNAHPGASSIALAAIAINSSTEVVYSNLKVYPASCPLS